MGVGGPHVSRPRAPSGYGYSTEPEGMLAWEKVGAALAAANIYWIASALPDGSPHLHSIWGGFVDPHLYIEGGDTTRWARNLVADSRVGFGVESGGLHINGRGAVRRSPAGESFEALKANYGRKYDYTPDNDEFWRIDPSVVIALDMSSLEAFASSPTKFTFEEPE
ncbi:MAG: pyridoxamine 5'-phosphate oxidase family protein [Acidimicrobiia bacterium]